MALAEKIVDDVLAHLHEGPAGVADELDLLRSNAEEEYVDLKAKLRSRVQARLDDEPASVPGGGASSDVQPDQPQHAPTDIEGGELPAG